MTADNNVLLVDDEPKWCEIYERAVRHVGLDSVRVAKNLAEAECEVDAMRFAVAVVDIGLQVDNDRNVDGLRVMEKIRSVGDRTSIIVITGRSGRDVLPIVRDAMKKFDAHDTVAKGTLAPAELRSLVESGLQRYSEANSDDRQQLYKSLHGDLEGYIWDDMLLRAVVTEGGAGGLYSVVEGLFGPYVPLVVGRPKGVQVKEGVAYGIFWSRATGTAIVGCFGQTIHIRPLVEEVQLSGRVLEDFSVGEVVGEYQAGSVGGVVYTLVNTVRSDFAELGRTEE